MEKEPTKGNVALPHNGKDPRHGVEQGVRGDSPLGQKSRELGHESSGAISLFSGNSLYLHTDFYFQLFCKQSFLSPSFFCKQNLFVTFTFSKQSSFACLYFCHFDFFLETEPASSGKVHLVGSSHVGERLPCRFFCHFHFFLQADFSNRTCLSLSLFLQADFYWTQVRS